MRYISTRGQAPPVSFLDAVLNGMAPDGGLYVPESWPGLDRRLATLLYATAPSRLLELLSDSEVANEDGANVAMTNEAYIAAPSDPNDETWRPKWPMAVTPLRQIGPGQWSLELFHGPSLSFKDVAMQLLGPLYSYALERRNLRSTIVCATSGDTGGAAVEALKNRDRLDLFVLTPKGRVSEVQRRFMTTSCAPNVSVVEVDGDFDACQAIVKALFADADFSSRAALSAVNSINWARIVAQSAYFHVSAQTLAAGGPASFVVPTGNFGDAYSGWVAKQMGAPIARIVVATNENDILARALATGRYERGASKATLSPAMDIQLASNFERILFEALGRDAESVRSLYANLAQTGGFVIPAQALQWLREAFDAVSIADAETLDEMRSAWIYEGDALCPHTAVGRAARVAGGGSPRVFLATAHPAKFPDTVERATGVRPQLPAKCADLFEREEKFDSLPADVEVVKQYIRERSRAWS
jgi:threonine synthase